MMQYTAVSKKGTKREFNNDRVFAGNNLINGECSVDLVTGPFAAVVCDGVGTEKAGGIAAGIAAKSFIDFNVAEASLLSLSARLRSANKRVLEKQKNSQKTMAAAVAGIMIANGNYMIFNIGDTRVYKYSGGTLRQISVDHTRAQQMLNTGEITNINQASKEEQNTLTGYIGGFGGACRPAVTRGSIRGEKGYFLICSDGVYKGITKTNLENIFAANSDIEEKKRAVCKLALKNSSADDMSMVLIKFAE